jgi:hypothetical protein|tara:strand:+ start:192 stop:524 length:333 start_codon:yes stop_codon:yes gene_type:complete
MTNQITEMEVTNKVIGDNNILYHFKVAKPTKFKGENAVYHYKAFWDFKMGNTYDPQWVDQFVEITLESGKVMPLMKTRMNRYKGGYNHNSNYTKKFTNLVKSFHKAIDAR